MRIVVSLFFLLISIDTFAQGMTCLSKLLPYNRYSGTHQIVKDEWTDIQDTLDSELAKKGLRFLTRSKLLCRENEVVIKVEPVCGLMIKDLPQSNSCFAFTNLGYFVISRDAAKNMNFIFSKDKQFSK